MNATAPTLPNAAQLSIGEIAQRIHLIRGRQVMLDTDLAASFSATTKRFEHHVRRSQARYTEGFIFQLNTEEAKFLKLLSPTSDAIGMCGKPGLECCIKYLPMAHTEYEAGMAATLLNSPGSAELSVYVVYVFAELRGMLTTNLELTGKVTTLERKVSRHERNIAELVGSMAEPLAAPLPPPTKRSIEFKASEHKPKGSKTVRCKKL